VPRHSSISRSASPRLPPSNMPASSIHRHFAADGSENGDSLGKACG
jgi:hypothetical protein